MCLQFGFVIFWQKDFGAKAANKMLVKLTPAKRFTGNKLPISDTRWQIYGKWTDFVIS
jgi:hypothetical protein